MPLETATYIPDLVATNPAHSDGLNNADAHARMIKGVIKATFPNFTGAALNSTQAQIDGAVTTLAAGVTVLADAGASFKTNSNDGFTNPGSGQIGIKLFGAGNQVTFTYNGATSLTTLAVNGPINSNYPVTAPGIVPIGGMLMWLTDTLPTVGSWCWANGGTLSRTGNGAALYALTGTTYGVGDGVTTFNVINMQEVVPVGKSTMGGASSPGLLTSISSGVKGVLNGLFGADTHALTVAEMPVHSHANSLTDPGHSHQTDVIHVPNASGNFLSGTNGGSGAATAGTTSNTTGITITNANAGSGTAHSILQPSRAVNFIIRIG